MQSELYAAGKEFQFEELDSSAEPVRRTATDCDWKSPADMVALKTFLWENKSYKRRIEEQAIRNTAYAVGDQHRRLNRLTLTMEEDRERPRWQNQISYNVTQSRMLTRLSRLERVDTEWGGAAETDDDSDRVVARLQRKLASHYYRYKFKMPDLWQQAAMTAMMHKVAFFQVDWNPLTGSKKIYHPEDFAPIDELTGQPNTFAGMQTFLRLFGHDAVRAGHKVQWSGDANISLFPVFELITWPFNATHWNKCLIWMRTQMMTPTTAARMIGQPVDRLRTMITPKEGEDEAYEDKLTSSWSTSGQSFNNAGRVVRPRQSDSESEMLYVHQLWLDPRFDPDRYPNGRTAIVVEDFCAPESLTEIPFENPRVPIFVHQDQPIPNVLFGTCLLDQIRAGQDEVNDCATAISNARRRAINPTIVTFGGWRGPKKKFDNAPGMVMELSSPDYMPQILKRPDLPNDYERCIGLAMRMIDDIAGTADIDRGLTDDSQVRSGVAITALQRKNDTRLAPQIKSMRNVSAEMCDFTMELLQKFGVGDRVEQIIGENNRTEIVVWNREILRPSTYGKPGVRGAMVRCTGNGALPMEPAEILAAIKELTPLGYLNADRDTRTVLKAIGGDLANVWDSSRVDAASEVVAIEMFREGQVPPLPRDTSDFAERLEILGRWINGDEYTETIRRHQHVAEAIAERKQALRQGQADRVVEDLYLKKSADLRMRNKYLGIWMKKAARGEVSPQLVVATFGQPALTGGPPAGSAPGPENRNPRRAPLTPGGRRS